MTATLGTRIPPSRYGLEQSTQAEFTKIASLRSTLYTLLTTVVGTVGITALLTHSDGHHSPSWYQGFDPTNESLGGLALATLAIGVFGVLAITGEYSSGTIRTSMAAAPRRPLLCATKILVVGAVTLIVGEVIAFLSFFVGQAVLGGVNAPTASIGQSGVLQALVLSGICMSLIALIGLGLGMIVRNTAGAISAFVGVVFLLPVILKSFGSDPSRYTPLGILANSVSTVDQHGNLDPIVGFVLMIAYTAITVAVGTMLLVRRDA